MKRLLLLPLLVLPLASCGGGVTAPPPPVPYSAVGVWDINIRPQGVTDWRYLGSATWTTQGTNGSLDGTWYYNDTYIGRAVGNATAKGVGLTAGYNVLSATGTWSGNTYAGTYETVGVDFGKTTGDIRMTRR